MFYQACTSRFASTAASAIITIGVALGVAAPARAVDQPTLAATVIDGASAYTPTQLFAAYREQLGRPISTASSQAILAHIEALYLRDGYSQPEFRLDDDVAANGVLRIEVFEPQITRVRFTGEAGPYAARLEELASDLSLRVPLRQADLQAALREMRSLPGLTVHASTHRDESRRNAYALTVDTEYEPFGATLQLSNRGPRAIGRTFAFGEAVANSPFGLRDRAGLFASAAADPGQYRGGGVYYEVPASAPDALDPTAPISVGWSAAFEWEALDIASHEMPLRTESVRVLELGGHISGRTSAASQYLVGVQVRRGLDDFVVTRLQLVELVRLGQRWTVRVDGFGQQSAYVLPDVERYRIDGERFGRGGFQRTRIAADQGWGAKAELRREMSSAAALFGKSSLYGFYDFAAAWKQDEPGRESAAIAGLGFAIDYWRLSAFLEVAKPLTQTQVAGDRDTKVFAEVLLKL